LLGTKNIQRILAARDYAHERRRLRMYLRSLWSLTAAGGCCVVELPFEYDDPLERDTSAFGILITDLLAVGFSAANIIGSWEYNDEHRARKDRIIYHAFR
jgi:hypothetical protein